MQLKNLITGLLYVTILFSSTLMVFANAPEDLQRTNHTMQVKEDFVFGSFKGTVKEINKFKPIKGAKIISLENEEGMPANMIITKDTYIVKNAKIAVGDVITGYYNANAPMILIYPPQYNAEVVVVENNDYNVKVDIFNEDLVSSDNMLKLNIADNTKVVTRKGKPFKGELANRKLVVIYGPSTKSIPAQATPIKVIVLA